MDAKCPTTDGKPRTLGVDECEKPMNCALLYSGFLEALNHYSNLLLVIVTVVYVVLSWKNLRAFQRSVQIERESKHLDEIKAVVASPILNWINEVEAPLKGVGSRCLVSVQTQDGTDTPSPFQITVTSIPIQGLSEQLYADAMTKHFPDQLKEYDSFRRIVDQLMNDVALLGRECCEELWKTTRLPPPKVNDRSGNFVDFERLVQGCLRFAVCGLKPVYYFQDSMVSGSRTARVQNVQEAVATGSEENMKDWLPEAIEFVESRWRQSKMSDRITRTLQDAESLRGRIRDIGFMQLLPGTCKYVGR